LANTASAVCLYGSILVRSASCRQTVPDLATLPELSSKKPLKPDWLITNVEDRSGAATIGTRRTRMSDTFQILLNSGAVLSRKWRSQVRCAGSRCKQVPVSGCKTVRAGNGDNQANR